MKFEKVLTYIFILMWSTSDIHQKLILLDCAFTEQTLVYYINIYLYCNLLCVDAWCFSAFAFIVSKENIIVEESQQDAWKWWNRRSEKERYNVCDHFTCNCYWRNLWPLVLVANSDSLFCTTITFHITVTLRFHYLPNLGPAQEFLLWSISHK